MPENVSLNITDIADAVKIIDFFAAKCSFDSWDNIRQIMMVRDRLDAFIAAAQAQSGSTVTPADSAVNSAGPTAL